MVADGGGLMSAGLLNDPLVPLDFGGYFRRVFTVIGRDWRRLATVAAVPGTVYLLGSLAIAAAMPNPEEMQRIAQGVALEAGGEPGTPAVLWAVFGPVLPVALVYLVAMAFALAFFVAAVYFLAIRRANGQPAAIAQALAFARPRVLPLIGWTVLLYLVCTVLMAGAALPVVLSWSGWVAGLGLLVGIPLALLLFAVFVAAMVGTVVVERAGPGRAIDLVRGRLWPTCGRMVVAGLIGTAWNVLTSVILLPLESGDDMSLTVGSAFAALIGAVLLVPSLLFGVSVSMVSFAELRHRQDRTVTTSTLAAALTGPPH